MVLTESAYFERLEFETPLDLRLRADTLGHSVLFLGYSMSDINIRYIFYKLWKLWRNSGIAESRPPSYAFMMHPNQVQEAVLANWGIQTITNEEEDPETALQRFLARLLDAVKRDEGEAAKSP